MLYINLNKKYNVLKDKYLINVHHQLINHLKVKILFFFELFIQFSMIIKEL